MHYILIDKKQYKHLNFKIDSKADLNRILNKFDEIEIPGLKIKKDLLFHSIIELVNNSLRAQLERNIEHPVKIRFSIIDEDLQITISDKARGFDPQQLPFNLDDPISSIDINGKKFQDYREKYIYKHFGTGLYNAKKLFDKFDLSFVDELGKTVKMNSPHKEGTVIKLLLQMKSKN